MSEETGSRYRVGRVTPNAGYKFANWANGGSIVSTSASYTFIVSADSSLVANFEPITHTVSVSALPAAGGSATGGGNFSSGSSRTVTATPNAGYKFANWANGGSIVSTSASYTFIVSASSSLVANFEPITHTVSVSALPAAGGSATGGGNFSSGSSRTVTATPNAGYKFANWANGGSIVSTSASYTFIVSASSSLVANFEPITHTVSVSASPAAGGSATGGGNFPSGSSRTVTATPNAGYKFANWTKEGSILSTTASYSFTLTANTSVVANFVKAEIVQNDLLVDFGASGLSQRMNDLTWIKVHATSALDIAAGDLDGDGRNEAIATFLGTGIWARYQNSSPWVRLHTATPLRLVTGDLDGNGQDDLLADFLGDGFYALMNDTRTWVKVLEHIPLAFTTGDLNGDRKDDTIASLVGMGLWARYSTTPSWLRLHTTAPLRLITGDLDGNGKDDLLADFLGEGLYARMNDTGTWVNLLDQIPLALTTGDLNGDGKDDVIAGRVGAGLWARYGNSPSWVRLHTLVPVRIVSGDLDRNGRDDLVADFLGQGLYALMNDGRSWLRLHTQNSRGMVTGGFD